MAAVTKIRYYKLSNRGAGVFIFPIACGATNPSQDIIWDGNSDSGFKYVLTGREYTVDLTTVPLPQGTPFVLACEVSSGTKDWITMPVFEFDPNSDVVASAKKSGTGDDGGFELLEMKRYDVEKDANPADAFNFMKYLGRVSWPVAVVGVVLIAAVRKVALALINAGYTIEATAQDGQITSLTFKPPQQLGSPNKSHTGLPPRVLKAWNDAVAAAAEYKPTNLGVTEVGE